MATRLSGYAPQAHQKFYTPPWVVSRDLASLWQPPRHAEIWEPCAGDGRLARAIAHSFGACFASDLYPDRRQYHPVTRLDFLSSRGISAAGHFPLVIITNPPFTRAAEFLVHALDVTEPTGGSVVFLLPFGFDAARGRAGLTGHHPAFAAKITTSQRIRWSNIPQKENGPSGDHALFIYEWNTRRRAAWAGRQLQVAA